MRTFCFLLLWMTGFSTWGQQARFSFGLGAGVGLAGSHRFVQRDPEVTDQYHTGLALSAGLQFRYRLTNQLALLAGIDLQRMQDGRTRIFNPANQMTPGNQFTSEYTNQLLQVVVPVQLQWNPISALKAFYVTAGGGPKFLRHGNTRFTAFNTRTGDIPGGELDLPLDIPANRFLRSDWVLITGAGLQVNRRLSLELTHQFAKSIAYSTFDPGSTYILPPMYTTRASQGWLLTTTFWIN